MTRSNRDYHTDRAEQERTLAEQSDNKMVAKIHRELADQHAAMARKIREKPKLSVFPT